MSQFPSRLRRALLASCLAGFGLLAGAQSLPGNEMPGKGVKVFPLKSSIAEENFQTQLVVKALQKLGYDVQPIQEVEYPTAHLAIANGDATFMANHWVPLHEGFYKNAGGDDKLTRKGLFAENAIQGYLIDKKTADQYGITRLSQLKDPKLAALFDANGDGKADLTGCTPGWGCEAAIEHQLDAFELRATVTHQQGTYSALIADTISRYKAGKPILYYTWTPFWVSAQLKPGTDVMWLEVPFSATPGAQGGEDTRLPNGKNYGFVPNRQHILANKQWAAQNPAAGKLFEIMTLSINDINAQNNRMFEGENKAGDIERHVAGWIEAHQETFDGWLAQARAAAR